MREVNGDLRMSVSELIDQLKKLPFGTEVSNMNSLKFWIQETPKEKVDEPTTQT